MHADTETVRQVTAHGRAVLASFAAASQIPAYHDPASSAVASAMANWPTIQAARTTQPNTAADEFIAAIDKTSWTFAVTHLAVPLRYPTLSDRRWHEHKPHAEARFAADKYPRLLVKYVVPQYSWCNIEPVRSASCGLGR